MLRAKTERMAAEWAEWVECEREGIEKRQVGGRVEERT
jgi:hypothetical protein